MCNSLPGSLDGSRVLLPQGSPASPVISNIVCRSLDRRLQGLARRFAVTYTRYADDITFSADHNVFRETDDFIKEFRRIVAATGFTLNEKKLRLQKRGGRQEVTGLLVTEKVNVTRAFVRDLSCILHIWERYGADVAYARFLRKNLRGRTCGWGGFNRPFKVHMLGTVRGRLAYLKMVKGGESPVWQRLWDKFFPLFQSYVLRPIGGTRYRYYHSWTIDRFEHLTGARLIFETNARGRGEWYITKNGFMQHVCFSRYCRTRMEGILWNTGSNDWQEFKREYRIGLTDFPFLERREMQMEGWMVFRKEPPGIPFRYPYRKPVAEHINMRRTLFQEGDQQNDEADQQNQCSVQEAVPDTGGDGAAKTLLPGEPQPLTVVQNQQSKHQ